MPFSFKKYKEFKLKSNASSLFIYKRCKNLWVTLYILIIYETSDKLLFIYIQYDLKDQYSIFIYKCIYVIYFFVHIYKHLKAEKSLPFAQ